MKSLIIIIILTPILILSQITEDLHKKDTHTKRNIYAKFSKFGAGVEYANNSEIGILGQYNFNNNISIILKVRRCTHDKKIYFSPGVKYYFSENVYGLAPFINIRYEKIHYDLKSSQYVEKWDQYWDPNAFAFMPYVYYTTEYGSSLINSPALSIAGGGEYYIKNFGITTTIGLSHYTKVEGKFKEKNKFFFTISALYYFDK